MLLFFCATLLYRAQAGNRRTGADP